MSATLSAEQQFLCRRNSRRRYRNCSAPDLQPATAQSSSSSEIVTRPTLSWLPIEGADGCAAVSCRRRMLNQKLQRPQHKCADQRSSDGWSEWNTQAAMVIDWLLTQQTLRQAMCAGKQSERNCEWQRTRYPCPEKRYRGCVRCGFLSRKSISAALNSSALVMTRTNRPKRKGKRSNFRTPSAQVEQMRNRARQHAAAENARQHIKPRP